MKKGRGSWKSLRLTWRLSFLARLTQHVSPGGGSGSEKTSPVLLSRFRAGQDKMRTPHCIRSSATQCDLSNSLSELTSSYTAEVLSEPPLGETSEGSEAPYQRSPRFCPYNDSRCLQLPPACFTAPDSQRSADENHRQHHRGWVLQKCPAKTKTSPPEFDPFFCCLICAEAFLPVSGQSLA